MHKNFERKTTEKVTSQSKSLRKKFICYGTNVASKSSQDNDKFLLLQNRKW